MKKLNLGTRSRRVDLHSISTSSRELTLAWYPDSLWSAVVSFRWTTYTFPFELPDWSSDDVLRLGSVLLSAGLAYKFEDHTSSSLCCGERFTATKLPESFTVKLEVERGGLPLASLSISSLTAQLFGQQLIAHAAKMRSAK